MKRRDLLKKLSLGTAALAAAPAWAAGRETIGGVGRRTQAAVERLRRGQMTYRRLGRTGLMISEIALGG
ncbi:MAG: twin-arginine translocation signal domain-containing protein, partial [Candidatus Aminicenantes bacterium]|nr:twin-arginine translocation signal domain-containing protein [Candidatus Aminicenantes bacterium]